MNGFHRLGEQRAGALPDVLNLGGKAKVLDELARARFSVPHGFVVPSDLELSQVTDPELTAAVESIGGFPVAARSSGTMEDLATASFAGQYVTFLEIANIRELREKIQACRDSVASPQVLAYLKEKKIDPSLMRMNVLVQKMVDARTAGVCFSIHPLTGHEEHALIECCAGLGEKLVSGHISPTRYIAKLEDGVVVSKEIPENAEPDSKLDQGTLRELVDQALRIQAHYGRPQDIEWAVDRAGKLWILQSRPVTQIQWRRDIEEYTNADFKDGGVSARVCSPLMYSLYRDAMQGSMPGYLKAIKLIPRSSQDTYIGCYYGRPYWNASAVKRALTKVPGFDEKSFDQDLGIQKNYGPGGPLRIPTNLWTILPAIPVAIALEKNYKVALQAAGKYGERFLPEEARYLSRLEGSASLDDAAFFPIFREVLELHQRTEFDYFTTIYNNSNAQSDFKKVVEKIAAVTGREISLVRLMAGLTEISHMKIQQGLLRLCRAAREQGMDSAAFGSAMTEFLRENYFHGDSELDLTTPRWGESPVRVRQIVAQMLDSGHELRDPDETAAQQNQVYRQEVQTILSILDRDWRLRMRFRGSFVKQLERSRAYLVKRETMREYSTRSYHLVRKYVLEAGHRWHRLGLIEHPDDIFMSMTDEILAWIGGEVSAETLRRNVAFRKLMYLGYRNFVPPDELGGGVEQRSAESYLDASDGKLILRGAGCSPGVIEGRVRIIAELADAGSLQKGEILVTRFTDPGWTPVLGVASGVVTEVGGLLSHAAVIGREYGIPAVLNIRGATQALKTGQRVRVDGQAGTVEVLE